MGKFRNQMREFSADISQLLNRNMQRALRAGIAEAVRKTRHDSSNAAYHWMVVPDGPAPRRAYTSIRDLRQTKGVRGPQRRRSGTVGLRGAGGANKGATIGHVRRREDEVVIRRAISGRKPPGKFHFYHALLSMKSAMPTGDLEQYRKNADIEAAGEAAVAATLEAFKRYMAQGKVRKF